ncbi:hypothetical protein CHARACLAT_022832 [Characodon lateralis]|uniref:Uncharacterized protein n=1 Tax=Characodon lateralis TaxID=208331 RepID=A0ABU7F592_9TELE|nr:hypothetical protein [Characodon lateralis]
MHGYVVHCLGTIFPVIHIELKQVYLLCISVCFHLPDATTPLYALEKFSLPKRSAFNPRYCNHCHLKHRSGFELRSVTYLNVSDYTAYPVWTTGAAAVLVLVSSVDRVSVLSQ